MFTNTTNTSAVQFLLLDLQSQPTLDRFQQQLFLENALKYLGEVGNCIFNDMHAGKLQSFAATTPAESVGFSLPIELVLLNASGKVHHVLQQPYELPHFHQTINSILAQETPTNSRGISKEEYTNSSNLLL